MVGNAYVYKPAISEEEYKKKFMGNVVKEYFDNSYKELVNFFVEQKKLSAKELKEILAMIEKGNNKLILQPQFLGMPVIYLFPEIVDQPRDRLSVLSTGVAQAYIL